MLLKTTRTAVLTVAALDTLFQTEGSCCQRCCGICWVLADMLRTQELDLVVSKAPIQMYEDAPWWDAKHDQVNRLAVQLKMEGDNCLHGSSVYDETGRARLQAVDPRHGHGAVNDAV
jgi:hypothetical protein